MNKTRDSAIATIPNTRELVMITCKGVGGVCVRMCVRGCVCVRVCVCQGVCVSGGQSVLCIFPALKIALDTSDREERIIFLTKHRCCVSEHQRDCSDGDDLGNEVQTV